MTDRVHILVSVLALTLIGVPAAHAQMADDPLSADRPGFGTGATTMASGTAQSELGYQFTSAAQSNHSFGQLLLRYGVTDRFEVRANIGSYGLQEQSAGLVGSDTEFEGGYNGAAIEAKAQISQTETTTASLFSATTVPLGSGPFASSDDRARQTLALLLDGALGQTITLSVNAGANFYWSSGVQDDRFVTGLFIPTLSFVVNDETSAYVGYSGEYTEFDNTNYVEGGLTYLLNNDTQLDVNTGLRLDDTPETEFFLGLGLAHRF